MFNEQSYEKSFKIFPVWISFFILVLGIGLSVVKSRSSKRRLQSYSGGASKLADNAASGKYLASLTKAGQAILFTNLPAANKLAIRYSSINVGTISVAVNNEKPVKVNIHSSGALTGSFLYAIIDLKILQRSSLNR